MRIEQYLDQVMAKRGLKRDKQLAEWLGVTPVSISNYRAGERFMDNEKCLKLALELEIDPMKVIMATDLDKADKAGNRSVWEIFLNRAAATAGAVLVASSVNVFLTPTPANAASMRVSERPVPVSIDYANYHLETVRPYSPAARHAERSYLKLRTRGTLIYRLGVKAPFSPSSLYV